MKYKVITEPTAEFVSVEEARRHCRIIGTQDDAYLSALITAARETAEGYHGLVYAETGIAAAAARLEKSYDLPVRPFKQLTSVIATDRNGETHDLTEYYTFDTFGNALVSVRELPHLELAALNPVIISYIAGSKPSSRTKQAILLLVGHWYEHREAVVDGGQSYEVPMAADALLQMERHL